MAGEDSDGLRSERRTGEIHGGYGDIDEYPVQKFYRDAKVLEIYEGTKEAEILAIGGGLMRP